MWASLLLIGCTSASSFIAPAPPVAAPALAAAPLAQRSGTMQRDLDQPPRDLQLRCEDRERCPASIGMLVYPGEAEPERCTATLVGSDTVLTASHCVARAARHAGASCAGAWLLFADTGLHAAEWVACERVIDAADVDDSHALRQEHALLKLAREPVRPVLRLDPQPVEAGAIVTVVSVTPHPVYASSHWLSTRLCRVEGAELAVEVLGHDAAQVGWLSHCPIERGNSGSPVLDHDGHVRALVHGGTHAAYARAVTSDVPLQ